MTTPTISPAPMVGTGQAAEGDCEGPDVARSGKVESPGPGGGVFPSGPGGLMRAVPGEAPRPTDVHSLPHRPRRGELHGADDPWDWADNRGATLRTVRRKP